MDEKLEFRVNEEWEKGLKEKPWLTFVPEFAKGSDGTEYMRKRGSQHIYKIIKIDEESFNNICNSCNSDVLAAKVAHPIWDGPFPMSGSGRCYYETIPYCPKCEKKPDFSSTPIEVGEKIR